MSHVCKLLAQKKQGRWRRWHRPSGRPVPKPERADGARYEDAVTQGYTLHPFWVHTVCWALVDQIPGCALCSVVRHVLGARILCATIEVPKALNLSPSPPPQFWRVAMGTADRRGAVPGDRRPGGGVWRGHEQADPPRPVHLPRALRSPAGRYDPPPPPNPACCPINSPEVSFSTYKLHFLLRPSNSFLSTEPWVLISRSTYSTTLKPLQQAFIHAIRWRCIDSELYRLLTKLLNSAGESCFLYYLRSFAAFGLLSCHL